MSEQRIKELEDQLAVANASIATLTATNLTLTSDLSDAETRNRKMRRSAKNDASSFKDQLNIAQNKRS